THVFLEVIEQNEPAIALYEDHGFERINRLVGFAAQLTEGDGEAAREVPLRSVADSVRAAQVPWQIAAATLLQISSPAFGIEHAGIYAALTPIGEETLVCRGLGWVREPNI